MTTTNSTTRRFQNTLATSFKFWMVTLDGRRLHFDYGRIGTAGQHLTKEYSTQWRAEREMALLINQKLAKGYVETTLAGVPFVPTQTPKKACPKHAWHRGGTWETSMICVECGQRKAPPNGCNHAETWLRTKDGIYRCRACGLVDAPSTTQAAGASAWGNVPGGNVLTIEKLSEMMQQINGASPIGYDPPAAPSPYKPKQPPSKKSEPVNLRPRRKITLEED